MAMRRPEPGFWTYEDLQALPDDGRRYEIVRSTLFPDLAFPAAAIFADPGLG